VTAVSGGSAQMAREERVYRAALALEAAVRPGASPADGGWTDALLRCVRAAVEDLAVLIEGSEPSPELDGRLRASLERWQEAGVELPGPAVGRRGASEAAAGMREFRAYAARELDGITEAIDEGMRALRHDPLDREAVKGILRRQRALRGAARLEEVPVVAEILRAIEDVTRVVVKLDMAVKDEWFEAFRLAREGLSAAIPALNDDRDPQPSSALARLRHLRAELLARYGPAEGGERPPAPALRPTPISAPPPPARPGPPPPARPVAAPPAPAPPSPAARAPAPDAPVPIESLEYRGDAALRRALSLRQGLEDAIGNDPAAREQLEELFDLIRLAIG